ncbi:histidine phosphatase family protein [Pseudomonas sp. KU43P]|uniref:histidine phosphatase family protein n=1 Tax=Pseudomonas sp. KU43P TaxID=2487887 RepID=UPI0012AA7388|nr:histidine phosphatase family protein [Pseudomonas sp. KU43P]BBH48790.1 phosphoglycerate mutase [Pseudomonas sp. KU43P]
MKAISLTLISHAATEAQRLGRFHAEADGVLAAAIEPLALAKDTSVLRGPELRATQTASLLGSQATVEPALRDCDVGRWEGLSLKVLQREEPDLLQAWLSDPESAPHGGESVADVCRRVAGWLDGFNEPGHWLAVTHPMIVRAAMMHVLQSPLAAFHRIDVQPLAQLHLSHYGMWRVKLTASG